MSTGKTIFVATVSGVLVAIVVALFSIESLDLSSISPDGLGGSGNGDGEVAPAPAAPTTAAIDADCVITVTNSLAKYFEEPGFDQLEVGSIPTGRYGVSDIKIIDFAGTKQRWFYIQAAGRPGWVYDDTFFVEDKEGDCR